jgi:DNA-directed RNA polymerase specialized sigma24 family protein
LASALESLPVHYLEVVWLRDFEALTIAKIADRLSEPYGAIKSRLHRARWCMNACLGRKPESSESDRADARAV